jgi:sulfur carrier protein
MSVALRVNGEAQTLSAATVAELLRAKTGGRIGPWVAVAVNGTVVPRREWEDARLREGDDVEIVGPLSGG